MKTEKNILIAFVLNFCFAVFEFAGGVFVGSVAIISDAVHDLGDSLSIAISYLFERKSKELPDDKYTYGYARFSLVGGLISYLLLVLGSAVVIYNSVLRLLAPTPINYNGMIIFAVVGCLVNASAAFFTRHGESLNQKAVNLHMLEDVLGWFVILVGAIVMRFTELVFIDSVMSIGVAGFILVCSCKNIKDVTRILLEKVPAEINIDEIERHILRIDGVKGVHHFHIWSIDGINNYATMHIVTDDDACKIKNTVRHELAEHNIRHVTLEIETSGENCQEERCVVKTRISDFHHHKHH